MATSSTTIAKYSYTGLQQPSVYQKEELESKKAEASEKARTRVQERVVRY